MSSIITGYNYDIFISYRQKDNKGDRWVSEFVEALKTELESTFKEEIGVYFDINPHDGLLETHDVDESLKEKLKCLVFIPIISRTYCDPKSFAWEHEFMAFVEQASHDQFGLKVKLPNGNVASRVLPIRIHDLDIEDIRLCESVLGGVLRGVEFIYKSPGVNRPLRAKEDKPHENLNNTIYRDQINKVALAIKEIITGLKTESAEPGKEKIPYREPSVEVRKEVGLDWRKRLAGFSAKRFMPGVLILAVILIIAAIVAYPKIFKRNTLERLRASGEKFVVVIMPFQNLTNDTLWNVWQSGIQNELITYLTNSEELKVRQTETINSLLQTRGLINYASLTPSLSGIISKKLEASILISGSINQAGNIIRVNTQLIDSRTNDIIKSFQIESSAKEEMIFNIIDSLSIQVKDFLIITTLRKESSIGDKYISSTNSVEAYRYFMLGQEAFYNIDYETARDMYLKAIAIDSNFYSAITMLSTAHYNLGQYAQAKKWCLKVYGKRSFLPTGRSIHVSWLYAMLFETPNEEIKYINQLLDLDDQFPPYYYELGRIYVGLNQYDDAIAVMRKALGIYKKWESKPRWVNDYIMLGYAYHETARYRNEKNLYKKAEQDFPNSYALIQRQAILSLTEKDTITANKYIDKFISLLKDLNMSDVNIAPGLGYLYTEGGYPDKAEECYRSALSMEPENPSCLNNLAWFLIDQDKNINEGLELIDKALKIRPNSFLYLGNKGLGLYKLHEYDEALEILQKSWDLRRQYGEYDHDAYLFLEKVKKAAAGQK